jgi:hypothetical protein
VEGKYRRRRAAADWENLRLLEGHALALAAGTAAGAASSGVSCTVVAAGVPYGMEGGPFRSLLQRAWTLHTRDTLAGSKAGAEGWASDANVSGSLVVASPSGGKDAVPTIHVKDLAAVLAGVALGGGVPSDGEIEAVSGAAPSSYLVAVDRARVSLRQVAFAISRALGNRHVKFVEGEEGRVALHEQLLGDAALPDGTHEGGWLSLQRASLSFDQSQSRVFDVLSGSVADAVAAADGSSDDSLSALSGAGASIAWHSEAGMVENMPLVTAEFVRTQGLRPVKAVVTGPPGSGAAEVARGIAIARRLPLVTAGSALAALRAVAAADPSVSLAAPAPLGEAEERPWHLEPVDEVGGRQFTVAKNLLKRVEHVLSGKGALGMRLQARLVRWWLSQPVCRNHGWVLAGYPRGYAEAEELMKRRGETEDEEEDAAFVEAVGEGSPPEDTDVYEVEAPTAAEEDEDAVAVAPWLRPAVCVVLSGSKEALVRAAGEEAAEAIDAWGRGNAPGRSVGDFFAAHAQTEVIEQELPEAGPSPDAVPEAVPEAVPRDDHASAEEAAPPVEAPSVVEVLLSSVGPLLDAAGPPTVGPGSAAELEAAGVGEAGIVWKGGPPCNFHPTPEEVEEELSSAAAAAQSAREKQSAREAAAAAAAESAETARREQEANKRKQLADHEAELLEARSQPLREWLGREILPALSRGLLETVKHRPADPIDFLAEFLLREAAREGEETAGTVA